MKKLNLNMNKENPLFRMIVLPIRKVCQVIKRADNFAIRKKIYPILCVVLFSVVSVMLINSYDITKTYSNSSGEISTSYRVADGVPATISFTAEKGSLESFRINKDMKQTRLSESDKATVTITDEDNIQIYKEDIYLYNSSRNYITVECNSLSLDIGEKYTIAISASDLADDSVFYLMSHNSSQFASTSDSDQDSPTGYINVPNILFTYNILSIAHIIPHLVLWVFFLALLFQTKWMKHRYVKEAIRAVFLPMVLYLILEVLNPAKQDPLQILFPLTFGHYFRLLAGLAIILLLYYLFYAISGRGSLAMLASTILLLAIGYTNHAKIIMRGDPAMPWDFFSIGMAAKIGSKYYFVVTLRFVISFFMCAIVLLLIRLTYTPKVRSAKKRIIALLVVLLLWAGMFFGIIFNKGLLKKMDVYYELYPPLQSYNENGTLFAVLLHLNNLTPAGGDNNSAAATDDVISKYADLLVEEGITTSIESNPDVTNPNVIVIMNESFSDPTEIRDIETTEEVMPFYNSLKSESMYGDLQVSIFGGGTCNTEFEFLTGWSVRSLLAGGSVYTFYANHQIDALPQIFKDQGYDTLAIHPFDGEWWDRATAYPLLGFDQFITRDDFVDPILVRGYISDKSAYERVIQEYENNGSDGAPMFTFLVTMQNHADYQKYWSNMNYDIQITNFPEHDFFYTEHYFDLVRNSDDALSELISYFKTADEPTIIVIFGDHRPSLDADFYSTLLGMDLSDISIQDSLPLYETPYLIWANYDIPTGDMGVTSPNFLGQTVLDLAGLESPDERACLRYLQTKISAITALAVFDKDGTPIFNADLLPSNIQQIINDYEFIEYGEIYYSDEELSAATSSAASDEEPDD